jgi:hypothetical protein
MRGNEVPQGIIGFLGDSFFSRRCPSFSAAKKQNLAN